MVDCGGEATIRHLTAYGPPLAISVLERAGLWQCEIAHLLRNLIPGDSCISDHRGDSFTVRKMWTRS
jgi:hypothetical protein